MAHQYQLNFYPNEQAQSEGHPPSKTLMVVIQRYNDAYQSIVYPVGGKPRDFFREMHINLNPSAALELTCEELAKQEGYGHYTLSDPVSVDDL